jgi:excisionase family DNA binding protein
MQNANEQNDVLTLNEAAAILRVHPVTLRRRAVAWGVPHRRLGVEWRFSREVLAAWMRDGDAGRDGPSEAGGTYGL